MSSLHQSGSVVSRRMLLKRGAAGLLAITQSASLLAEDIDGAKPKPASASGTKPKARARKFLRRPDLLDQAVRDKLDLIQLTTDAEVGGSHIYMEAPVFTPDSRRFILQRSGHAHGSERSDPHHQFMLCDIEDNYSLHPLTEELGTTGPAVSPDGKYFYYFVDDTSRPGGVAKLNRVNLDGTDRQTLFVLDHRLPGTNFRPTRLYPLSTISSDGKRLVISGRLSEKPAEGPLPYGLMVFDLERATVELVLHGPTWANMHPQYCRSRDPELMHDILIQENHHRQLDIGGAYVKPADRFGADIHVIRDDGTNFRDLPWGRDGNEFCQGHQCWRGRSAWAITSTSVREPRGDELIESMPVTPAGHLGIKAPGGVRNMLSREYPTPRFHHFATDITGQRFITDFAPFTPEGTVMTARLGQPGKDALTEWTCIARPRCSGVKTTHLHPFLSPDGHMAFFNSDESGRLQAYMIRGL